MTGIKRLADQLQRHPTGRRAPSAGKYPAILGKRHPFGKALTILAS